MQYLRFLWSATLIFLVVHPCTCDEAEDASEEAKSFGSVVGESMNGFNTWFKSASDDAHSNAENGMEVLKNAAGSAKEQTESGVRAIKGAADGFHALLFGKVKETFNEAGETFKAMSEAAVNSKEQFDTSASKLSKNTKDASDTMFGLFF